MKAYGHLFKVTLTMTSLSIINILRLKQFLRIYINRRYIIKARSKNERWCGKLKTVLTYDGGSRTFLCFADTSDGACHLCDDGGFQCKCMCGQTVNKYRFASNECMAIYYGI